MSNNFRPAVDITAIGPISIWFTLVLLCKVESALPSPEPSF